MGTNPTHALSEFGQAAVTLDAALVEFEKLVGEFDRLVVESDKGLERGLTLLDEIQACRNRLEAGMQALSQTLTEARNRNERAEKIVAEKGVLLEGRRREAEQMFARFKTLGDAVVQINASLIHLKDQAAAGMSEEDKALLVTRFPEVGSQLEILIGEAKKLVEEARAAGLKGLERNADSLRQSLASAHNRIHLLVTRQADIASKVPPESTVVH